MSTRPADRKLDYDSMSLEELKAELESQREHMDRLVHAGQRKVIDQIGTEYTEAAIQLRGLLTDGIDPDQVVDILHALADLLEAEALMERHIGPISGVIFGAVVYSGDYPVLFEATPNLIKATPTFHLLAIADSIMGLEDRATDEDLTPLDEVAAEHGVDLDDEPTP